MYLITVVEDYIGIGVCRSFVMDVVHDFVLENYNNQDILAYPVEVILKKLVDKYWNLVFGYNILVPHSRRLYPPKDNDGVRAA